MLPIHPYVFTAKYKLNFTAAKGAAAKQKHDICIDTQSFPSYPQSEITLQPERVSLYQNPTYYTKLRKETRCFDTVRYRVTQRWFLFRINKVPIVLSRLMENIHTRKVNALCWWPVLLDLPCFCSGISFWVTAGGGGG